jgi:hypothetical protein
LAHFAVDPSLVYVTTELRGGKTAFLPFNQGHNLGAGNPPSWKGFATAYLWEQVWARDSVLNLLQHFIHIVEIEGDKGNKTGERRLLFPRCHQLDCVQRIANDPALEASLKVNPPEDARLTFNQVVNDRLQEMVDANFKFYKQVTDNDDFAREFFSWMFDRYRRAKGA